jgi:feruloyl esterase
MLVLAATAFAPAAALAAPADCESLGRGARVGDATVLVAQPVPAGDFQAGDGMRYSGMPAFCRVVAVAAPSSSSSVLVELWLPAAARWNGHLLGIGNGGYAGKIASSGLAAGLRRGYATTTTDMGTAPAAVPGVEFNFGNGRPEQIRDFGHRATHAMTVLSKDLVARYYGAAARRSIFTGCSTGGNQALSEAQKYPADYDGIIAGAPAHNRTHMHVHFSALRRLGTRPGASISAELMAAWTRTILRTCAGRDGGAPGDLFLTNPLQCSVSPRVMACRKTGNNGLCFSDGQVEALETIYAGIRNPRTGGLIYSPDVRGAEETIWPIYDSSLLPSSGYDITQWILPLGRPAASFDFDRDLTALDDSYASDLNAMNPDLAGFAERGGKLLMYHGWADGIISPLGSLDWFRRISGGSRPAADFARLFMVPGMGHCAAGPGATDIGQIAADPSASQPATLDMIDLIERWLDGNAAPTEILARKTAAAFSFPAWDWKEPTPDSRPVCAFPMLPRYDGHGDRLKADSFRCAPARWPAFPSPAAEYLR